MENQKISIHNRKLQPRIQGLKSWNIPEEEEEAILLFLGDLALGKVNRGRRISDVRQLKYLDLLKIPLEFFGKPSPALKLADTERFERALGSNEICNRRDRPYAHSTKVDIRKVLKIYLKWRLGDNEHFRELTNWFDTRDVRKTPDFLSETQIDQLYLGCKTAGERFLVAVLFDSGARAEEFHNIRSEDVHLPSGDDQFVKITLKEEYSKTRGRTISLYWKHSLQTVRDYLREREKEEVHSSDPIFAKSYDNCRQFLHRLGKRVLGRSIHYHLFRHSSATFFASKLNRHQLCYRYGWKFSSDMPDVYISRAGIENKELDERLAQTEIGELRAKLSEKEQENRILKDTQERILAEHESFRQELADFKYFLGETSLKVSPRKS